jgi:Ca-activated chloride channel homolog
MIRRTPRCAAALLLLVLALLGDASAASAADVSGSVPTVLIIDSSGSMAAREPDGRAKLDAARDTVVEALRSWAPDSRMALVAYGHRRESDCADIETLLPMGPLSTKEVAAKLAGLRARGKTPLSDSLKMAATLLPEGGGAIVLVSDGKETCDADPCAVAAALRAAHADVVIHVVGFGVTGEETAQLQCIAENGKGSYFGAADAGGLATALKDVVAEIVAAPPPTPPEPPAPAPQPPATPVPVNLVASAGELGRIVDAPVSWHITADGGESVYEGESRALSLTLPPGRYRAEALAANAQGAADFEVGAAPDAPREFEVPVKAGRLDLSLVAGPGAAPFSDQEAQGVVWKLEPLEGQGPANVLPIAKPVLLLAPGKYKVSATLSDMSAEAEATVAEGKPQALALDFRLGTMVLEAALAQEGEPLPLDDATMLGWRIGEGDAARKIEGQAHPRVTLREGSYPVVLSIAGAEVPAKAEVVAGEERTTRVLVNGGTLTLAARLGPQAAPLTDWQDTAWTVEAVAAAGVTPGTLTADRLSEASPSVPLTPGRWKVSVTSGAATVAQETTIAPDAAATLTLDLNAARVSIHAAPAGGEPSMNVVVSITALGADGTPAEQAVYEVGTSADAATIVPAGRWRIGGLDEQGRQAQTDIELKAGEERAVDLTLQ